MLFAYDSYTPWLNKKLIPRNIDVLNFHHYYAWNHICNAFKQNYICWSREEGEIPETTKYFLIENPVKVNDVLEKNKYGAYYRL